MPTSKEFVNGFDFDDISSGRLKKSSFDKSTVIADTDKSCHSCQHKVYFCADKKAGVTYKCEKTNYLFQHYWKQTKASECEKFLIQ